MAMPFQKEKNLLPILLEIDTSSDKIILKLRVSRLFFVLFLYFESMNLNGVSVCVS
jgi:hypothetical protein